MSPVQKQYFIWVNMTKKIKCSFLKINEKVEIYKEKIFKKKN